MRPIMRVIMRPVPRILKRRQEREERGKKEEPETKSRKAGRQNEIPDRKDG
jgi:hypothetical protein